MESSWDFIKLVDEKGREDRIFLLASGVAFNLILALIPLLIITITAMAFFLDPSKVEAVPLITSFLSGFIPVSQETVDELRGILADVLTSAPTAASVGTIAFVWLSTRLFGSLRQVLSEVFDIEETRNVISAKLFDMRISLVSSIFLAFYVVINAYLLIATSRGVGLLSRLNLREDVMRGGEYMLGRLLAFLFLLITFLLLYRFLPNKRAKWRTAAVAALFTSVMFEIARFIFATVAPSMNPASMYSGVIATVVVAVIWAYYVAVIFILGGEVSQVYDLRRARRVQRVVFE